MVNWLVQRAGRMPSSGDRHVHFGLGTAGRVDGFAAYLLAEWRTATADRLVD
ncbi:MAG: hypothetical protein OXE49_09225 [Gemmatimonadetes bacterium]|nr:hypothetical protein [Gemmatimonadota bacterium]